MILEFTTPIQWELGLLSYIEKLSTVLLRLRTCGSWLQHWCTDFGMVVRQIYFTFNSVFATHYRTVGTKCFTCSYFNVQEIEVIVRYVEQLLADRFSGQKLRQQDIGVITPYRKQVGSLLCSVLTWRLFFFWKFYWKMEVVLILFIFNFLKIIATSHVNVLVTGIFLLDVPSLFDVCIC